jgi:hypothetical protein
VTKKTTFLAVATLLLALIPGTAMAASVDGAGFAADCNADGRVDVTGTLRVVGGSGDITVDCLVVIDHDSKLVFRDTAIGDSGCVATCFLVVGGSGENSLIRVVNSTISVSGVVQLSAGCCSGGELPEANGLVRVVDSTIHGGESVEISASVATEDGQVVVRRSTISGGSLYGIAIRTFNNGTTVATDNTITSGQGIEIGSGFGTAGETVARRNVLNATGPISITASGGSCISRGNTPSVPCS